MITVCSVANARHSVELPRLLKVLTVAPAEWKFPWHEYLFKPWSSNHKLSDVQALLTIQLLARDAPELPLAGEASGQ